MSKTLAPDFSTCMAYATYLVEVFRDKIHAISTNVGSDQGGSSSVSVVLEANEHAPGIVLRIVNSPTAKMMRSVKLGSMTAYVEQNKEGIRGSVMREALANGASLQEWAVRVKAALYGKDLDEPRFIGPDFDHGLALAETFADYAEMQSTEAFDEPVYVTADIARDMTDEEAAKLALDISLDEAAAESKIKLGEVEVGKTKLALGLTLAVKEDKELTMNVIIEQGDITKCFADEGPASAIVNAANVTLLGGGGVDGCIHRAAGPMLKAVCETFPTQRGTKEVRCKTGEAKVTEGFKLPADFVIHTVGPIIGESNARACRYETEKPVDVLEGHDILQTAITNCLIQAEARGVERIAFPAISCGVFGCPVWLFSQVLYKVLSTTDWDIPEVRVVLFQDEEYEEFRLTWPGNK